MVTKTPIHWTGLVERMLVDLLTAVRAGVSNEEFDRLMELPESLVDPVRAGAVTGLEVQAGGNGFRVRFTWAPAEPDDVELSELPRSGPPTGPVRVVVLVQEPGLARAMGVYRLPPLSSRHVVFTIREVEESAPETGGNTEGGARHG
ncbi:MAG: hypothetical protein FJ288_02220 [Planctomycetes bacterium]|nr:hypothetical protein [Planctomycetota bacterium]